MADTETPQDPGYETRDANLRAVVISGIGLFLMGLVGFGVTWLAFHAFAGMLARSQPRLSSIAAAHVGQLPPQPRLQTSPPADLAELRAREDSELHGYGWVDRSAGVVHIPIDRAIDLVAKEGLPARSTR